MLGTIISIHPTPNVEFTSPIARRLHQRDTILRKSADPSLIVQALLDLSALLLEASYAGELGILTFLR